MLNMATSLRKLSAEKPLFLARRPGPRPMEKFCVPQSERKPGDISCCTDPSEPCPVLVPRRTGPALNLLVNQTTPDGKSHLVHLHLHGRSVNESKAVGAGEGPGELVAGGGGAFISSGGGNSSVAARTSGGGDGGHHDNHLFWLELPNTKGSKANNLTAPRTRTTVCGYAKRGGRVGESNTGQYEACCPVKTTVEPKFIERGFDTVVDGKVSWVWEWRWVR